MARENSTIKQRSRESNKQHLGRYTKHCLPKFYHIERFSWFHEQECKPSECMTSEALHGLLVWEREAGNLVMLLKWQQIHQRAHRLTEACDLLIIHE